MKNFDILTTEELKKVFNNNEKLKNEVFDAAQDDASYWINEYLECFERGALECNIGYPGDYIRVKDQYKFIQGLKQLQKDYCYLSEDDEKIMLYADHLIDRYNNLPYYDDTNAARLDDRIEELTTILQSNFLRILVNEYNYYYDTDNLYNYFIESYADNLTDNYYIDDNFILYQHIEYEKCYK
jgi:hypothetical protein